MLAESGVLSWSQQRANSMAGKPSITQGIQDEHLNCHHSQQIACAHGLVCADTPDQITLHWPGELGTSHGPASLLVHTPQLPARRLPLSLDASMPVNVCALSYHKSEYCKLLDVLLTAPACEHRRAAS